MKDPDPVGSKLKAAYLSNICLTVYFRTIMTDWGAEDD